MLNSVVGSVLRPIVRSIFDVFGTRPSPSLALNFVTSSSLDPRITFTRTSNATVTDSTGTLVYAPHNLLTFSESFDASAWTKTRATVSANATVAPDGTTTADKLVEDTSSGTHLTSVSSGLVAGTRFTYSVFVKAAERQWILISPGSTWGYAWFNAATGAVGTIVDGGSGIQVDVTPAENGWYRCSISATAVANAGLQFLVTNANGVVTYTGDGTSGIFIWGAQLNVGSLQPYYPTTRKNLLGFTQEFDNAAWTKSNATVSANVAVDPQGFMTADKLVEDTASAFHQVSQSYSAAASSVLALSIYAKAGERPRVRMAGLLSFNWTTLPQGVFDLTTGTVISSTGTQTATITDVGNGWYRCTIFGQTIASGTATVGLAVGPVLASITSNNYPGDGTSGIFIWGAQLSDSASLDAYVYNPGAAPASTAYFGPRFDYDPVTLAPKGLLIEEQRTNLAYPSNPPTMAAGTIVGLVQANGDTTITSGVTSPDGTANGFTVTGASVPTNSGGANNLRLLSVLGAIGTYAVSMWIKTNTTATTVTLREPSSNTTQTFNTTGTWTRITAVFTSTSINSNLIILSTSGTAFDCFGIQVE